MGKFSDLPREIMLDIFTRLPAELVLDCKSVSKTWRSVIQNPSFYQIHPNLLLGSLDSSSAAANSGKLNFIFKMSDEQLYYFEYDDEISSHRLRKLNWSPPFELYSILGSYNGLICINGLPDYYTIDESTSASYVACIYNPITRESITLPELDRSTYYHIVDFMVSGFGYVASSNEYKVLRLYTFRQYAYRREHELKYDPEYAQIEVYTLGSGKGWRNAGKIKIDVNKFCRQDAASVNGFLYWDFGIEKTIAFDLAKEIFVETSEFWNNNLWMGVFGGYLSGTHYGKDGKSCTTWLLKKKEDESFSWSEEFSISIGPYTTPFALTSGGAVLCYSDTNLHLYDLKSSSSKMLEDFGIRIARKPVPHTNTLVSLKAFGEENTKTFDDAGGSSEISKKNRRQW